MNSSFNSDFESIQTDDFEYNLDGFDVDQNGNLILSGQNISFNSGVAYVVDNFINDCNELSLSGLDDFNPNSVNTIPDVNYNSYTQLNNQHAYSYGQLNQAAYNYGQLNQPDYNYRQLNQPDYSYGQLNQSAYGNGLSTVSSNGYVEANQTAVDRNSYEYPQSFSESVYNNLRMNGDFHSSTPLNISLNSENSSDLNLNFSSQQLNNQPQNSTNFSDNSDLTNSFHDNSSDSSFFDDEEDDSLLNEMNSIILFLQERINPNQNDDNNQPHIMINSPQNLQSLDQIGGNNDLFEIVNFERTYREKWRCDEHKYTIKFNSIDTNYNKMNRQIIELFKQISEFIKSKSDKKTKVRIVINHPGFYEYISTTFMYVSEFSIETIFDLLDNIMQSYKSIGFDDRFNFWIFFLDVPNGSGFTKIELDYILKSDCVKLVLNKDNLCLIRAILIAKAYYDNNDKLKREYTKINSKLLDNETKKMVKKCNLDDKPCTINELKYIQRLLYDYQISLIDKNGDFIFSGPKNNKFIYIWLLNNHYYAITNISRFFQAKFYCDFCKKSYQNNLDHKCINNCSMCNRQKCLKVKEIKCEFCLKEVNNDKCLEFHKNNLCYKAKICQECKRYTSRNHVCINQRWCKNCKKAVENDHQCYVLAENEKKKKEKRFLGLIFFDYEAYQENGVHVPNLVCALKMCKQCLDLKNLNCTECEKVKFDDNFSFCEWLFSQSGYIAIAHNMKGYDGVFVLNYISKEMAPCDKNPNVIATGSKLLCIEFRNVQILDSFSFIPIALAEFPKAFGITERKKGFFPHLFNSRKNMTYVGPYPTRNDYGVKFFTQKKLNEFNEWYDSVSNTTFDFKKEFEDYCWSDVLLLADGCLAFRKEILTCSKLDEADQGIEPFNEAITIASLCHLIYRKMFMQPKTLAYLPERGKNTEKNNSYKANLWLAYIAKTKNIKILSATNGGEKKIGKYYVDGYCEETDTVYEFHGCYFHGCPICFKKETFNQKKQTLMGCIYHHHLFRIGYLKQNCTKLVEIWECEFDKESCKPELLKFADSLSFRPPLNPRDALYGGRTNGLKLYYKVKPGEKIHYYDFTSLYPFVQKYCSYPIGHPISILDNFEDIENYYGFVSCKILPPRGLYIPVLGLKLNKKLVFTLCLKCANEQIKSCNHNSEERALVGTWCTPEVQKAVKSGYKILKIYEIHHYNEQEVYDPINKTGGIFTPYINNFLVTKQEASGFPSHVKTDEEKIKYVEDYFEKEGVKMNIDNIKKNESRRFQAKLALNSMWGRLGMNCDRMQYKIIRNPQEWYDMMSDDQYIISQVEFTDDVIHVFYKNIYVEENVQTSVSHAAFVTCHARLKLLSVLEKLGYRVLYFDTDSIIFVAGENDYVPPLGDYLGELTSELDDDDYIVEFVSAGPKNYSYLTFKNKTESKVKGFSKSYETSKIINFESIKTIVTTNQKDKIEVDQLLFKRNKRKWEVTTSEEKKVYGFVYDKRVLFDDLSTLPFGY